MRRTVFHAVKMSNPTSPPPPTTPAAVRFVDTLTAYNSWASVYDSDDNFLQALDTLEMAILLPRALALLPPRPKLRLVDLGCGTGRNTARLLAVPGADVLGLDLSHVMLEVARGRLAARAKGTTLQLAAFDVLKDESEMAVNGDADLVISTLVLEHIPLVRFFTAAKKMLKDGGVLLVTNMHSDMGALSGAGFVDPETGVKVRAESFAHTIEEVVREAQGQGFELVEQFKERVVAEEDCEALGSRSRKWVGIKVWYGGIMRKAGGRT